MAKALANEILDTDPEDWEYILPMLVKSPMAFDKLSQYLNLKWNEEKVAEIELKIHDCIDRQNYDGASELLQEIANINHSMCNAKSELEEWFNPCVKNDPRSVEIDLVITPRIYNINGVSCGCIEVITHDGARALARHSLQTTENGVMVPLIKWYKVLEDIKDSGVNVIRRPGCYK